MPTDQQIKVAVDAVVFGYTSREGLSVLLIKRNVQPFKNAWALPGGLVGNTETLEQAVQRELASDLIDQTVLKWQFLFNLAQLKLTYPPTIDFVFYIKGRSASPDASSGTYTITGAYNLKNDATTLVMPYTEGSYLPSVTEGGQVGSIVNVTQSVSGGNNGSYLEAVLVTILKLSYSIATNSITFTYS